MNETTCKAAMYEKLSMIVNIDSFVHWSAVRFLTDLHPFHPGNKLWLISSSRQEEERLGHVSFLSDID